MVLLFLFAFLSGLVTIFAPCIWPLLPVILSSTTTGGHRKPLGITLGIMLSFGLLTLGISYLVKIIPFDPNMLRYLAVVVIGFLGLTLLIPRLSAVLEAYMSRFSGRVGTGQAQSNGFTSGFVTGLSLGIIWTPCAGPILATIATLAATQAVSLNVVFVTFFYILGVGIPLFIFATVGKYLFAKSRLLSRYTGRVQQVFGAIMIVTALLIATNYDKVLQVKLLDLFPSYSTFLNNFEGNSAVTKELNSLKGNTDASSTLFDANAPARDFTGITKWLNTDKPLTIADLKGKVVLVDFWTYTCINCIRTLPFVTSWYDKYHDQGFVVIGVHTPEFAFEKDTGNVQNAIKMYNIHYPVAQDNNYTTWNNYENQYWPAEYLIDAKGVIRRTHFGEGEYDQMELAIQALLKEAGKKVDAKLDTMPDTTPKSFQSPETYLGATRMEYYYPTGSVGPGTQDFSLDENPSENSFSFGGEWNITGEQAITGKNSTLTYHFVADKVNLVLRPGKTPNGTIKVFLDGKPVTSQNAGKDVKDGAVVLDMDRLYNLIDLQGKSEKHILKLEFQTEGIEAFAFTFG